MPLVGGGGSPNVAGAGGNPSGVGNTLNYIGEHAYAYSGAIDVDDNATSLLKFTTGGLYVKGKFQPQYMVANAGAGSEDYRFAVKFDNQEVSVTLIAEATDRDAFYSKVDLIIPPFTTVEVTAQNVTDNNARAVGAIITGWVFA